MKCQGHWKLEKAVFTLKDKEENPFGSLATEHSKGQTLRVGMNYFSITK